LAEVTRREERRKREKRRTFLLHVPSLLKKGEKKKGKEVSEVL